MITKIHLCGRCSSERVRKNGSNGGRTKYQCTACGYQGSLQQAAPARAARYAQVEKLLSERNSQRSIVRATGVSRMAVAKLEKKAAQASPALPRLRPKKAQRKRWETLEMDEMWTFVGRTRRKAWLWLAVERASRRIVAWVLGTRGTAPAAGSGTRCQPATAATAGTTPTSGRPTPPCCRRTRTGATRPAKPTWSKPSTALCASAAAYSCANPVRSASH